MIFIRKSKISPVDEAWFDSSLNDSKDPIKIELQNEVNKLKDKEVSVSVSDDLDHKFFNYIAGQLMESKLRKYLNLSGSNNQELDGIYKGKYYIEIKTFFINKQSTAHNMFTSKEREFIEKYKNNTYGILCKYQHTHSSTEGIYKIRNIYVLTGPELLRYI